MTSRTEAVLKAGGGPIWYQQGATNKVSGVCSVCMFGCYKWNTFMATIFKEPSDGIPLAA